VRNLDGWAGRRCVTILRCMSKYQNIETESVARALAAIGSPVRLRLLLELASCCGPGDGGGCGSDDRPCCAPTDGEESCVGRIAESVHVAPSTVSHHIKELRDAGVIWCLKQGRRVCCGIDAEMLAAVRAVIEQLDAVSEPRPLTRLIGTEVATKQAAAKRAVSKAGPRGKRRGQATRSAETKRSAGTNKARAGSKVVRGD
jgi:ArsR family transcriptional regulator